MFGGGGDHENGRREAALMRAVGAENGARQGRCSRGERSIEGRTVADGIMEGRVLMLLVKLLTCSQLKVSAAAFVCSRDLMPPRTLNHADWNFLGHATYVCTELFRLRPSPLSYTTVNLVFSSFP